MKKLLLIDGNSIMNRAFFGIPLLTNSEGEYTNAVLGFINIITRVMDEEQATHCVVSFDLKGPTFRNKLFDEYKGTRKGMPEELRPQMVRVKELLSAMTISIATLEGYEADDVLGTLLRRGESEGFEVALLSGDRDMLQLATDQAKIIIPKTKGGSTTYEHYYAKDVVEYYGVTPTEFIDVKGLMGDTSDNIPGIPGVGEKTAVKLIKEHHTIEAVYEAREAYSKGLKQKVNDFYDQALLSRELATIITDSPVECVLAQAEIENIYTESAYELCMHLGLNSLLDRFQAIESKAPVSYDVVSYTEISSLEEVLSHATIYYHIFNEDDFIGLTVQLSSNEIGYIDNRECSTSELHSFVQKIIDSPARKVTLDFKQQLHTLDAPLDLRVTDMWDVSLLMYLIDPVNNNYGLDHLAMEYAKSLYPSDEAFYGKGRQKKHMTDIPLDEMVQHQALAIHILVESFDALMANIKDLNLEALYQNIELPLLTVLYRIEARGIKVDGDQLKSYGKRLSEQIDQLETTIHQQAGETFNIASPKQLGVILFEKLQLPFAKKTKTGYSTNADILEKLKPYHPIVEDVLTYRQLTKLKSTYADGLFEYIQEDGRIHSTFNQKVTSTGRISSTEPNLQNIPVRLPLGREIRKVFIPKEGHVFVDADYSQIELRLLAHLSGDETFIKAFREDLDIHAMTASQVFHVPFEEVSDLERRNAKAVNFGIVYGISAFGLSQDLNISVKEASDYIDQYFGKYPKVKTFLDQSIEQAKEQGYVTTMYDRIRPIPELKSSNFMQRSFGERVAMNTPIQGSAADVIKIAMIQVEDRLEREGLKSQLILQIHDELIIECPEEEANYVMNLLKEEMENAVSISVPLTVDAHQGASWYEAK